MFNLETAISAWRHSLKYNPVLLADDLDELERHIRDQVFAAIAQGLDEETAFRRATREMGHVGSIEAEYGKVYWEKVRKHNRLRTELFWRLQMFANYLKIAARLLSKQKMYSFINVLGLALGLASFAFIAMYVIHERSFDSFHQGADRIYRINKIVTTSTGTTERHALTAGLLGPAIAETFPEVEQVVRVQPWFDDVLLAVDEQTALTPDIVIADSNFFAVFGFEMLRGDPATVLQAPMSIVLTETTASRVFGAADPMGQTVMAINNLEFEVTGIAADPPPTSHLRINALVSWSSTLPGGGGLELDFLNRWITQAPFTYIRLAPGTIRSEFESKLPEFYASKDPERAARYELYLQPLTDIYLKSADLMYTGNTRRGNSVYVSTFSFVAILILAIASINFINLSTARGSARSKEVGVRKVLGAHRSQVGRQFLVESVYYSAMALVLSLVLVQVLLPTFANFSGLNLSTNLIDQKGLLLFLIGISLALGVCSGAYPAAVLSRFRPVSALRTSTGGGGSVILRNSFVVFQFAISMILVAATLVVLRQLEYVQSRNLGFDKEQLVVLNTDDTAIQDRFEAFRQAVLNHPKIVNAAGSSAVPGSSTMTFGVLPDGVQTEEHYSANIVRIDDFSLLDTYGFELVAGRFFDENRPTDATNGIVINEMMAGMLGWDDPVGRRLDIPGELDEGRVLGVVRDFHFKSLHYAIEPLAFYFAQRGGGMTVRLSPGDPREALAHLEATWKQFEPSWPFNYKFLDQSFARFYTLERTVMALLTVFAGLAIFIACLGLYGLASYVTMQRTKEIGIRRVLGASASQIVRLFSREFARLVGAAILLAVPVVYVGTREWLDNYAYRVSPGADIYFIAAGIVIAVALVSVSYRPIKAALADPVDALRYE